MDLGTIKHRLDCGYYRNVEECLSDFRLMFTNCYTYNQPDQDVFKMAQVLEKLFSEKARNIPPSDGIVRSASPTCFTGYKLFCFGHKKTLVRLLKTVT